MLRSLARAAYWATLNRWYAVSRFRGSRSELSVQWRGSGAVRVARGTYLGADTVVDCADGAEIDIGAEVWIGKDCEISSAGFVEIGDHCSLQHRTQIHGDVSIGAGFVGAAGVYVSSGWHEFRREPALPIRLQDRARAGQPTGERSRPVRIGEDCWLGIGVAVMPGVTIGRGCVVGANAVVTHDLPPYSIAAGLPARVLGQRLEFDPPSTIDAMNDAHLPYFYGGFRQIGNGAIPSRQRGGLVARRRFLVASPAPTGALLALELDSLCECRLRHGPGEFIISRGLTTVRAIAFPSAGLLAFEWQPNDSASDNALVLRHIGIAATGSAA
jgi:acetyltransferase-like isoleucine patch superfamily enzyme